MIKDEYAESYLRKVVTVFTFSSTVLFLSYVLLVTLSANTANSAPFVANYSILEYKYPWPPYELKSPWRSAMAQAAPIQALIRANEITHDNKYLETASALLNSFFVEVKDGGVTYKNPNGGWWYELFAGEGSKQSTGINGMVVSVLGIYDYYSYTHSAKAKYLFDRGVQGLKNTLQYYDYNGNYTSIRLVL